MCIVFNNITKKYSDKCGVFNLSFNVKEGTVVGLLGRNGAGKTTTIKLIMNLIHKDEGNIQIFSKGYSQNEKNIKEKIGFVYDDFFIDPKYNVKNINDMMRIYKFQFVLPKARTLNFQRLTAVAPIPLDLHPRVSICTHDLQFAPIGKNSIHI